MATNDTGRPTGPQGGSQPGSRGNPGDKDKDDAKRTGTQVEDKGKMAGKTDDTDQDESGDQGSRPGGQAKKDDENRKPGSNPGMSGDQGRKPGSTK